MQLCFTADGVVCTADAKKYSWVKKYLKSRGVPKSKLDELLDVQSLREYAFTHGHLRHSNAEHSDDTSSQTSVDSQEDPCTTEYAMQRSVSVIAMEVEMERLQEQTKKDGKLRQKLEQATGDIEAASNEDRKRTQEDAKGAPKQSRHTAKKGVEEKPHEKVNLS